MLLQGRNGRDTVANVRFFYEGWGLDNFLNFPFSDTVMMSRLVQDNLRVRPGDMVTITPIISMRQGTRVVILPFEGQEGPLRNLADGYLTAHFSRGYRPIHRGDAFTAIGSGPVPGRTMDFKVMDIETDAGPADYCYVGPETTIHCEGDPVKREVIIIDFSVLIIFHLFFVPLCLSRMWKKQPHRRKKLVAFLASALSCSDLGS